MTNKDFWWLGSCFWQADMPGVMEHHGRFLARQRGEAVLPFYGMDIYVRDGVYHPTECSSTHLLAEGALSILQPGMRVLEIGCGSGAVACLMAQRGAAKVVAVDHNARALECARINAARHGLGRVDVAESDLFQSIPRIEGGYDMVMFNAPLLHCSPMAEHLGYTRDYDDMSVDEGGQTLLRFIEQAPGFITQGGHLIVIVSNIGSQDAVTQATSMLAEVGEGRVDVVLALHRKEGLQWRFVLAAQKQGSIDRPMAL